MQILSELNIKPKRLGNNMLLHSCNDKDLSHEYVIKIYKFISKYIFSAIEFIVTNKTKMPLTYETCNSSKINWLGIIHFFQI